MNINQVWPEWNEDCVLGEGSFGKVYRARRNEYGRTFYSAIKVLTVPKNQQEIKYARSQGMNDKEIYDYFRSIVDNLLNEITLMDNLKGAQNIVSIEDYKIIEHEGEIGWDIFIRMELLTPFDSFVSNPEFSQKDVIRLGIDICTALEVCEKNYIIHRDIKPDNIFISKFGEYKLGDFGIARKLEATQANLSRKGTLNYMAPEVYKSEQYGSNVDIYSLGLVLYTLLNNNRVAFLPPYPQPITYKDNEVALSNRLSGQPLEPPCNAGASLSNVLLKACEYYPENRYQSATEFKNALISEWNNMVQLGDNREIKSDAMRYSADIEQRINRTTSDMTANGKVVVDEYATGTTVLDNGYTGGFDSSFDGGIIDIPNSYDKYKSNKALRILAWPFSVILFVLSLVLLFRDKVCVYQNICAISMLGIGVPIFLGGFNKNAIGISTISLSLAYILEGVTGLLSLEQSVDVYCVITLVSGVLLLCGGFSILLQKEARFGGSLCLYAFAVEWIYNLYLLINNSFETTLTHIFLSITALTVFIWSYGFKRESEPSVLKKVFNLISYVVAAVVFVVSLGLTLLVI